MHQKTNTKINDKEQYRIVLSKYLPERAVRYVAAYFEKYTCRLQFTRARKTKKGTFSVKPGQYVEITVNRGMTAEETLLVLLHEIAHLLTYKTYAQRVKPHGREWQVFFRKLLMEACRLQLFSKPLCEIFDDCYFKHSSRIATQCAGVQNYFYPSVGRKVGDLLPGTRFCITGNTGRWFILEKHRRTKTLCKDVKNGRYYLVDKLAEVYESK